MHLGYKNRAANRYILCLEMLVCIFIMYSYVVFVIDFANMLTVKLRSIRHDTTYAIVVCV